MKKNCLAFVAVLFSGSMYANTITVSNNPNSPGQFTNLQTAINTSSPNDTLLIAGSFVNYGAIVIDKKLTLIGQGFLPIKDISARTELSSITLTPDASGSVISGLYIVSFINGQPGCSNLQITRNDVSGAMYVYGPGWSIYHNKLTYIDIGASNNVIRNNLIRQNITAINNQPSGLIFTNNVFACDAGGNTIISTSVTGTGHVINNNIFYYKSGAPYNTAFLFSLSNCTINNNIAFNSSSLNPLGIGINSNTGTGNLVNIDPLFVSYDLNSRYFLTTDNMQLQPGSPAKNGGFNSEDIGAYGGVSPLQYPVTGEPAIPLIKTMNIRNPVAAPGATLKVDIKANANN